MKLALLLVVAVLLVSSAVFAQGPPVGYMGLYPDDSHSGWCATGVGFYPVEMWICCLPSENDQICAEFAMSYPSNVIQSTVTNRVRLSVWERRRRSRAGERSRGSSGSTGRGNPESFFSM